MRLSVALASAVFVTTLSAVAQAEPAARIDWGRLLVDVDTVARRGADVLDMPRCAPSGCLTDTNATAARPTREAPLDPKVRQSTWFGVAPKVSLVVRDWGSAYRVAGERLALVDALRLTTSTRMLLTRVIASNSRVAPFVQVGVGQWRTDPYLMPLSPRYTEIAAQAAGGIEVRVAGSWEIGLESTMTMLYRETRDATSLPAARNWSTSIATRFDF